MAAVEYKLMQRRHPCQYLQLTRSTIVVSAKQPVALTNIYTVIYWSTFKTYLWLLQLQLRLVRMWPNMHVTELYRRRTPRAEGCLEKPWGTNLIMNL